MAYLPIAYPYPVTEPPASSGKGLIESKPQQTELFISVIFRHLPLFLGVRPKYFLEMMLQKKAIVTTCDVLTIISGVLASLVKFQHALPVVPTLARVYRYIFVTRLFY